MWFVRSFGAHLTSHAVVRVGVRGGLAMSHGTAGQGRQPRAVSRKPMRRSRDCTKCTLPGEVGRQRCFSRNNWLSLGAANHRKFRQGMNSAACLLRHSEVFKSPEPRPCPRRSVAHRDRGRDAATTETGKVTIREYEFATIPTTGSAQRLLAQVSRRLRRCSSTTGTSTVASST